MKKLQLIVLSLAALVFARPQGFCTANAAASDTPADPLAAVQAELEALKAQNAEQAKQIAALSNTKPVPAEDNSTLALLCKGAGVDIADVRWRMQAGLELEQAVQAATQQLAADQQARDAAKPKGKK